MKIRLKITLVFKKVIEMPRILHLGIRKFCL